ncbi:MAG TPA: hypothetical protein VHB79_36020 [Polyangiaceae bacterium]|nr:hypothetical protein [Polyangiaceae bacterium]
MADTSSAVSTGFERKPNALSDCSLCVSATSSEADMSTHGQVWIEHEERVERL